MKQHKVGDYFNLGNPEGRRVNNKTLCGYELSVQELWWQRKNKWRHVNCKRCHQMRHRVVDQEDKE
jgi:hypothetical protein